MKVRVVNDRQQGEPMIRSKSLIPMLALLGLFASIDRTEAQGLPDPTVLPYANRQTPNWAAYQTLGIFAAAANTPYLDPVTGVRITKITSAAVPQVEQSPGIFVNNASMHVDYAEGGPFISREWGSLQHSVLVRPAGGYPPSIVDYQRGVGTGNWRQFPKTNAHFPGQPAPYPQKDLRSSFSSVAATPRILFFVDKDTLYRFNTDTMDFEGDGVNIPVSGLGNIPAEGHQITSAAGGFLDWMQSDKDDRWFVFQACFPNPVSGQCIVERVIAYDRIGDNEYWWGCRSTDGERKLFNCPDRNGDLKADVSDLNEPHLDRDGRYVILMDGNKLPNRPAGQEEPDCGKGSATRIFNE